MAKNARGQGRDRVFEVLQSIVADLTSIRAELADIKAKYDDHRHSVAGAAGVGTKPSTAGAAADTTASTVGTIAALTTTTE